MFEHLRKFKTILVTGSQRSGTHFVMEAVRHDLGCLILEEKGFKTDSLNRAWLQFFINGQLQIVCQCPALSRYVHHIAAMNPDRTAVVWLYRNLKDVLASQAKLNSGQGWAYEWPEKARYDAIDDPRPIKVIKDEFFCRVQKPQIKHVFEVRYGSLEDHPLWIPQKTRDSLRAKGHWKHDTTCAREAIAGDPWKNEEDA